MRFGILKLYRYLMRIRNAERIPKLPRMYASEYSQLDPDSVRIMARYGIRSPSGLKLAMKRHQVGSVDALAAILKHQETKRDLQRRLRSGLERLSSGTTAIPHQKEIKRLVGPKREQDKIVQARLKRLKDGSR